MGRRERPAVVVRRAISHAADRSARYGTPVRSSSRSICTLTTASACASAPHAPDQGALLKQSTFGCCCPQRTRASHSRRRRNDDRRAGAGRKDARRAAGRDRAQGDANRSVPDRDALSRSAAHSEDRQLGVESRNRHELVVGGALSNPRGRSTALPSHVRQLHCQDPSRRSPRIDRRSMGLASGCGLA